MLLVSYGEVIPMRASQKYSGAELMNECQKRKIKYECLLPQTAALPMHVHILHYDGQKEYIAESKVGVACELVARHHENMILRGE